MQACLLRLMVCLQEHIMRVCNHVSAHFVLHKLVPVVFKLYSMLAENAIKFNGKLMICGRFAAAWLICWTGPKLAEHLVDAANSAECKLSLPA